MAIEDSRPLRSTDLEQRYQSEQLRLVVTQISRLPIVFIAINVFIAWLIWRASQPRVALAWLLVSCAFELWRLRVCQRERAQPTSPPTARLEQLSIAFVIAGLLRMAVVPLLFSPAAIELQVMYTMVCVGLAAGGVATVGGVFWAFAAWAGLVGGALSIAWGLQGGIEGWGVGALVAMLFATLALYARDQGRTLRKIMDLAHDNETLAASLRVERDRAELASQSKTRFFAAASHDLRQPLHALSINATTLQLVAGRQSDSLIRELSSSITRALRQSNDLLDTLLDISQLDARVVETHVAPVDLVALLDQLRDEFAPTAAQRGLSLAWTAPAKPVWAMTDATQMRRVLGNLVSNALKFTRVGTVTLSLDDTPSGSVAISVADTGPGIALDEQERVFEDFYQINNAARDRSRGLGLGLSIVRRTLELLDARIELASTPGHGSRFTVHVASSAPPAPHLVDGEAADIDGVQERLDLRVLAIDDEAEILDSLRVLLPLLGCDIRCATDLATAVGVLDSGFLPNLLLVDHRLKDQTGAQAIASIRDRLGPLPAIIVTGDTAPHDLHSALGAAHLVLHKPVDGRMLATAMRRVMSAADAEG